jgi:anti-sigma-K factor RskA
MNEQELLELAPLAALDALDGPDRAAFEAMLPSSARLQAELRAFERVVGLLPLALPPVQPKPASRERVLNAGPAASAASRPALALTWLAAAAALVFAVGAGVLLNQRNSARDQARTAREQASMLAFANMRLERDLEKARLSLAEGRNVQKLIGNPGLRFVNLTGQQTAPAARGRALYDPMTREAFLLVAGLPRAPQGKAYEVWVIAGPAPTPAGTFQTDDEGTALVKLPVLDQTARVKTFAVSLEPEWGVPAPTGPIVLAGNAP